MYENYYNFAGELITAMRKTYYNDFKDSLVLQSSINYHLQGRKTSSTVQVNNNNPITTDSLLYNELGQLKNKSLHQQNNNELENIAYTYNPRGWLLSAIGTNFIFRLGYDNPIQGATPQYNGNISWQEWGIANNLSSNYKYVYDKLNRLTNGLHSNNIHNETNIKYDKVGNIKTLTRQGVQQNYVYNGNRLERLESNTIKNYTYNRNGSMVSDGEVTIKYYENGMPKEISKGSDLTYYVYDALGTKLFSNYLKDSTQFYVDGIEFRGRRNPKPYYIAFEDGYIDSSLQFNYNLKDHLGNIRKVINATSGTVTQSTDYYPFGLAINTTGSSNNKYLYNGKEIQSGSGFYDFEARMYDAGVGRWFAVDALAERGTEKTPFQFTSNNPINRIDPDGKWDIDVHANRNRSKSGYALLILKNNDGIEVFRTVVKTIGTGGRKRNVKNSDTPQGIYKILGYRKTGKNTNYNRVSFGPFDFLALDYQGGEGGKRNGMHVHGGRQEDEYVGRKDLASTHGCMRINDKDVQKMKEITTKLEKEDFTERKGILTFKDDLKTIVNYNSNRFYEGIEQFPIEQTTKNKSSIFESSQFISTTIDNTYYKPPIIPNYKLPK